MPTEEELAAEKALEEKINKVVHKAMTERDDRLIKKLTGDDSPIMKKLGDVLGPVAEFMKKAEEEKTKEPPKSEPGKPSPEFEARFASLEKELKAQKEKTEKAEAAAKAERERSLRNEERTMLTQSLSGKVKPALMDMVAENLHKNLTRDPDSGAVLWKDGDTTLPFKDGFESWTKSDYAKEVAPPREAGGSGGRGPTGGGPSSGGNFGIADLGAMISGGSGR